MGTLNWDDPTAICISVALGIVMTFSVIGNVLVILVIAKHKGMRTRTNLFLCSLAVSDLLTALILMPSTMTTIIYKEWVLGDILCKFTGFMMPMLFVSAIHTLMYMGIHKYVTIIYPFDEYITKKRTFIMIAASWVWALIISILTVGVCNYISHKPNSTQCGPQYPVQTRMYVLAVVVTVTCYVIPLLVLIFCYVRMFKEIRQYSDRLVSNTTLEEEQVFSQQRRITITLFCVLCAFIIGWTPYIAYTTYSTIVTDKSKIPALFNGMGYLFGYLNSAVNPIIYAFRSKAFRDGYRSIFGWKRRPRVKDALLSGELHRILWFNLYSYSAHSHSSGRLSRAGIHLRDAIRKRLQSLTLSSSGSTPAGSAAASGSSTPRKRRVSSVISLPNNFKFDVSKSGKLSDLVQKIMEKHKAKQARMKAEPESFTLPSEEGDINDENHSVANGDIGSGSSYPRLVYPAPLKYSPSASPFLNRRYMNVASSFDDLPSAARRSSDIKIVVSDVDDNFHRNEDYFPTLHYKPHDVSREHVNLQNTLTDDAGEIYDTKKEMNDNQKDTSRILERNVSNLSGSKLSLQRSKSARIKRLPSVEKLDDNLDFRDRSQTFDVFNKNIEKPKKAKLKKRLRRSFKVFSSQKRKQKKKPEPFLSLENLSKENGIGDVFVNPKKFHRLSHSCSNPDISIDRMVNVFRERQNARHLFRKSMRRTNYSSATEEKEQEVTVHGLSRVATDSELINGMYMNEQNTVKDSITMAENSLKY